MACRSILDPLGEISFAMSQRIDKPSKKKKASRKKEAQADRLFGAPNLELAAMLLASGLLLFIGRALARYLNEGELLVAQICSALGLGLGLFVLSAFSFSRKQLPERVSRPLQSAANWMDISRAQIILLALAPMLALAGWLAAGEARMMRLPQLAVLMWLLGIVALVAGSLTRVPKRGVRFHPTKKEWAIVATLFVGALLLRGIATAQYPWASDRGRGSRRVERARVHQRGAQQHLWVGLVFVSGFLFLPAIHFHSALWPNDRSATHYVSLGPAR